MDEPSDSNLDSIKYFLKKDNYRLAIEETKAISKATNIAKVRKIANKYIPKKLHQIDTDIILSKFLEIVDNQKYTKKFEYTSLEPGIEITTNGFMGLMDHITLSVLYDYINELEVQKKVQTVLTENGEIAVIPYPV
jgi:hypothetical protein